LYDNTKIAVARILGGEERVRTRAFSELQSHYLFADKFGRPAKGNDKGKVEGLVGYARRNFMVPIPRVNSWDELNAHLEAECRKRRQRRLRGHTETIGERFERDRAAMLPLPAAPYEACEKISARANSLSLVRYRANDYSVPTQFGHRQVWVKGYVHEVVITCGSDVIARHERSYDREAVVFDPLHYLALIEQKTRALDQAAPLAGWQLPECFATLRRLLEARLKKHGSREYVQVLRLMETFTITEVTRAVEDALGHHQLRRREASAAVPHRAKAAAAGYAELSAPAAGAGANHTGLRLHGTVVTPASKLAGDPGGGGGRMSSDATNPTTQTADTPQLLLEHHLKQLRLPTSCASMTRWRGSAPSNKPTIPATCCAWPSWS